MKTKQEIVQNWLPRYTKRNVEEFTKHILLTNFSKYVEIFANHFNVPILGEDGNMPNASAEGVTIINFGMGSANAATVMDLLSAVAPKAVLFSCWQMLALVPLSKKCTSYNHTHSDRDNTQTPVADIQAPPDKHYQASRFPCHSIESLLPMAG